MKAQLTAKIKIALIAIAAIWAVWLIDVILPWDLTKLGLLPRHFIGLIGIFTAPLLHGSLMHIVSNTVPLFVLLLVMLVFYERIILMVVAISVVGGGILVWIFAREAYHVGASGLIYSLVAFIIASGILRKNIKSIALAVIVVLLYGGVIWGIFPGKSWVSWEGHLFGFLVGIGTAYLFRNSAKQETEGESTEANYEASLDPSDDDGVRF